MWSRVPLVRLIIPFVLGILLAHSFQDARTDGRALLWMFSFLLITAGVFYGLLFNYKSRWVYGSFIILFFLCCGYLLMHRQQANAEQQLAKISQEEYYYLARLDEPFEMRTRSCRSRLTLVSFRDSLGWHDADVRLMLYTEPDSSLLEVTAGTYMLLNARIKEVSPPANPGEFDYKKYLAGKGIFHTAYLKVGSWKMSSKTDGFDLMRFATAMRNKLLVKLQMQGVSGKHFGIASALLLGEDSHLDADIRDIYARAGAMHILCVSGLHVGVIFLVLNLVFSFMKRIRPGRALLPVLLMICIWMYALLTGLAPPVVRASCMISFFILGNALGRHKNVYNTLAASALLMLLIDPYVLFGAGFQLSYSAVLGIISNQQPLNKFLYFKYIIPDRIWSITSVSIAAQLGTLPVVLYYFHQFPLYSLLTNLIVIPISSLIIYSGMLLFLLPISGIATHVAAWVFKGLISFMDTGVILVERIPFGMVSGIMIDLPMALMISLIICSISAYLMLRYKTYLFITLIIMLLFSGYKLFHRFEQHQQRFFVVYALNGHSAYGLIQGSSHLFMADSLLLASDGKLEYSIYPFWLEKGLSEANITILPSFSAKTMAHGTCKMLNGTCHRIAFWQGRFPSCHPPDEKLKLDFLILRGKCPFHVEDLFHWFDPETIILDSSVPPWVKVPEGDVRFWVVRKEGAFLSPGCRVPVPPD